MFAKEVKYNNHAIIYGGLRQGDIFEFQFISNNDEFTVSLYHENVKTFHKKLYEVQNRESATLMHYV